jgi:hypothetical protein
MAIKTKWILVLFIEGATQVAYIVHAALSAFVGVIAAL